MDKSVRSVREWLNKEQRETVRNKILSCSLTGGTNAYYIISEHDYSIVTVVGDTYTVRFW